MPVPSAQAEAADSTGHDRTEHDPAGPVDRRSLRSRQVLMDALSKLLRKKEFDDISIQEISDAADLTRATFYLHYPDKGALLQAMTAVRLGEMLKRRAISSPTCAGGLKAIALGVCEYLAKASGCPKSLSRMPLERSVIQVIEGIFHEDDEAFRRASGIDPEIFATVVAWAIFGAASRWAQTPNRGPAEQMAEAIASTLKPLLRGAASARPG